ncbi:hypothetical protein CVU37_05930 [candidate division BRC1 bacterium HGW-BRC1-1]|nr:MAG: hypothetical protein CVU37_05930 [candidate division BRC1 bacterium HGW-BRC1-1]
MSLRAKRGAATGIARGCASAGASPRQVHEPAPQHDESGASSAAWAVQQHWHPDLHEWWAGGCGAVAQHEDIATASAGPKASTSAAKTIWRKRDIIVMKAYMTAQVIIQCLSKQ